MQLFIIYCENIKDSLKTIFRYKSMHLKFNLVTNKLAEVKDKCGAVCLDNKVSLRIFFCDNSTVIFLDTTTAAEIKGRYAMTAFV